MDKQLSDFYNGKRVLITGNTGFKGSWLSLVLFHFGAKIVGYSQKENIHNTFSKDTIEHTGLIQEYGEITNKFLLEKIIEEYQPEVIFHLAAQPLVSKSYKIPFETMNTNAFGTLTLLEILRSYDKNCSLIFVTSDNCYDLREKKEEYTEEDLLGGYDPYSLSKAFQEQLFKLYYENYFRKKDNIRCCSLRSGNLIGGGDFAISRIIPDLVSDLNHNKDIILRNPNAVRPWMFVLDTIHAYLLASITISNSKEFSGQSFNIGPQKKDLKTVNELVNLFIKYYTSSEQSKIIHQNQPQFEESNYIFLSTKKIREILKWQEKYTITESVEETAKWYTEYYKDKKHIVNYTLTFIETYFKK
ncbi:MAG: CDP-glucose 4,6-dehydratase [Bacteroidia bacterium]|nr:CDP-glucose 4,6-dehydratase [Bacteroidia bacterium]